MGAEPDLGSIVRARSAAFLGSGTTIIAAERVGRRCYGVELDPRFADTVIARYGFTEQPRVRVWARTRGVPPVELDVVGYDESLANGGLTGARLVRRIQPAGSAARYEARVGDNHHHVVCRSCGAIADVDCAVGETPCLTADDDQGYSIDEAEVTYWGVCPRCDPAATTT